MHQPLVGYKAPDPNLTVPPLGMVSSTNKRKHQEIEEQEQDENDEEENIQQDENRDEKNKSEAEGSDT